MKKSILMLSAACLLIVASCKKDNKTDDQANDCLLTESSYAEDEPGGENEATLYSYDANGRVIGLKYKENGVFEDYEDTFTYSKTQITRVEKNGTDTYTTIYMLDDKGRIVSEQYNGSSYKTTFTYNADGYLVESKFGNVGDADMRITKYVYANGNLTTVDYGTYTVDYVYNTELVPQNFFIDAEFTLDNILKKYFGKQSKNLVSKVTNNYGVGNQNLEPYIETYTYEKDAKGNVTKVRALSNDGDKYTVSSKYSCK